MRCPGHSTLLQLYVDLGTSFEVHPSMRSCEHLFCSFIPSDVSSAQVSFVSSLCMYASHFFYFYPSSVQPQKYTPHELAKTINSLTQVLEM